MEKYPRLSFRLSHGLLTKINYLSLSRHRTRGQIIREAIELYFRAYNPVVTKSNDGSGIDNVSR